MTELPGVDLASFQGQPDHWSGAAGKFSWAAVKITELEPSGNRYVNPDVDEDWAWLASHKKGRIAYLFGHPSVPAADSVDFFASELAKLGLRDKDAVSLDLETNDGLPSGRVADWAVDVMHRLDEGFHRTPLLYTYRNFAETGNCAGLGGYPLWMSDPNHPAGQPFVPAPWDDWAIHQWFTGSPIDRNVASYKSLAAMQAALGKSEPHHNPSGDPMQHAASIRLKGKETVHPDRKPFMLTWHDDSTKKSPLGPGDKAVEVEAAALMLSCLSLRLDNASSVRMAVQPIDPDGKEHPAVAKDYEVHSGWVDFVAPVDAKKGWKYGICLTNFGTIPLVVTEGTWQLIK